MATANKEARGTKRTCQSNECGARFYDLSRNPIICPICGTIYELASSPLTAAVVPEDKEAKKPRKTAEFDGEKMEDEASSEEDVADDIPDLEESDETIGGADDETFLEEEEEGGDVTGIIGGAVAEGNDEN